MDDERLFLKFVQFMQTILLVRYGPSENVSARLMDLFNQTHNVKTIFNRDFPKLISRFMETYPQH